MASFDVIPMEHSSSGSFQSGEYSFLPEVSVHPGENGVSNILVNGEFDLTNMQSTLSTASPDLSVEEVHSRLVELVEENQSLKEALHKNNSLMKDQITTISAWREDMILAKNQQGQSLKMTKEQISLLEKENAELQEKLSNLEIACEVLKNPESCGNCKSLETVLQSLQTENMSMETSKKILVEEIDGMTQFQEQIRQNLLGIYNQLHNFLRPSCKIPRKEKEELNVALQCLGTKLGVLGGDLGATLQTDEETGYVVINQKEQQAEGTLQNSSEVESLKKDLEAKNKELDIFRKREEELCQMIKSHEKKLEENEMQQKATYELMNSKQERDTSLSDKYKERCESLQQQIDEYQVKLDKAKMSDDHRVEQLREEAKNLQDILKLEQRANQKDKDKLAEVMEKCEQLQVDHDRVTRILEIQTRDEKMKSEEVATRRESEVKDYMEQFDFLTAKSLDMEEQLGEKQEEINKLKEKLSEVWEESETIPILKAQIEVYKTDLQHAVSTRDTAHAEIENLERELKRFKKHDSDHRRKSGHHAKDDTARTDVFSCPFCDMGFNTVNAAENHIEQKHTEKM